MPLLESAPWPAGGGARLGTRGRSWVCGHRPWERRQRPVPQGHRSQSLRHANSQLQGPLPSRPRAHKIVTCRGLETLPPSDHSEGPVRVPGRTALQGQGLRRGRPPPFQPRDPGETGCGSVRSGSRGAYEGRPVGSEPSQQGPFKGSARRSQVFPRGGGGRACPEQGGKGRTESSRTRTALCRRRFGC